jgi:hypothetical protein
VGRIACLLTFLVDDFDSLIGYRIQTGKHASPSRMLAPGCGMLSYLTRNGFRQLGFKSLSNLNVQAVITCLLWETTTIIASKSTILGNLLGEVCINHFHSSVPTFIGNDQILDWTRKREKDKFC